MNRSAVHPKPGYYFRNRSLLRTSKKYRQWKDFCCRQEHENIDKYYQFGYETFGAILFSFCKWLMEDVESKNIHQIIFFSRDGFIIKEAFELIPESKKFDVKYAYVSRRSLRVPMLWKYDNPSITAIHPTKYISIQDLFESIGLDAKEYMNVIASYGYELDAVIRDEEIEGNHKVVELLNAVWNDVIENSKNEYETAESYINQLKIEYNVAVVDIGWRGSMQHYLSELLKETGRNTKLNGYYITLSSSMLRGQDMRGFLVDVSDKGEGCDIHRGYVGLLETMFLKTEGSVCKYSSDNKAEPILYTYEYEENGKYTKEARAVSRIQSGALRFIKDYIRDKENFLEETDSLFLFSNLHCFATNPSMSDLAMFEDFRFYNGTVSYLAKAQPFYRYIFHPKALISDFYGARWRIGFMKSLFKVKLPYNWIFSRVMGFVKK